jgi:glycosyltransferase involved in cell wall biosynthesis
VRILFAQRRPFYPNAGGRAQRLMIEQLVRLGHDCRVVTPLCDLGYEPPPGSLRVHEVPAVDRLAPVVCELAADADLVVLPNDDPDWTMLAAALDAAPGRVVCIVHSLQQLPFGASAFHVDDRATGLLARCAGIVCVSQSAQQYLETEAGLSSVVVYPHLYDEPDGVPVSHGDAVMLVNPSAYTGIDVLLGLAARLPDVPFVGVRGWATTAEDVARMQACRNVEVVEPGDLDEPLTHARTLLMPSLWDEAFGHRCVEAMLHGVPVLASKLGGLVEAKLGVPYLLPVNRIETVRTNGTPGLPACDVPAQDLEPWEYALADLWSEDQHHATISDRSRDAARRFVDCLAVTDLHDCLQSLAG